MDNKNFLKIYNDISKYPTIKDVAKELGVSDRTVQRQAKKLKNENHKIVDRKKFKSNVDLNKEAQPEDFHPSRILRQHDIPFSESQDKYKDEWKEEDCIAELKRIVEENPDKVISRNFFRVHSRISEATWNRYFGTWAEFKRQAGIVLTRQQHALERDIAKQASVDHYRELSEERKDWGERFIKENNNRFKTLLVGSDFHDKEVDPFFLRCFLDTAKRINPDIVVLDGDIFDLAEFGKYDVDPRDWDAAGRISAAHELILKPIREAAPEAQIDLIEGNHEYRMCRHICDASPALKVVLSELHGFGVKELLCLDELEINYIAGGDLFAYSKSDINKQVNRNYKVYYDCFLAHHEPVGKKFGLPGVNGHHHKTDVITLHNEVFGSYNWVQMGAGHVRKASYCNGEHWQNGFAIVHIDTVKKHVMIEPIVLTDFACIGGKYYYRNDNEIIL